MLRTEYIRSLNCNYERIRLENKPEENRYQYCILNRGGIRNLLSCNLRYIDGDAYLYYDISSTQSLTALYSSKCITRSWMKEFLWSVRQLRGELSRFLLDDRNIIWSPEHIFQDLEKNEFYFLYMPYYEGECGFLRLIEYWVEHIDYEDDALVELVYKMHEQYELLGTLYLEEQIFEDEKLLDKPRKLRNPQLEQTKEGTQENEEMPERLIGRAEQSENGLKINGRTDTGFGSGRPGIFRIWEERRRRQSAQRKSYENEIAMQIAGELCEEARYRKVSGAVGEQSTQENRIKGIRTGVGSAESTDQEALGEEYYGRTVYVEESGGTVTRRLYTREGRVVADLQQTPLTLGKRREESDCVISDISVSRIHARILSEGEAMYIEDLNSTNGTFKNGVRMKPYEKKRLEPEDEIRLGKVTLVYR